MVKHAHTIRRQKPMNYLCVFDHFVGLAIKGSRRFNSICFHFLRGNFRWKPIRVNFLGKSNSSTLKSTNFESMKIKCNRVNPLSIYPRQTLVSGNPTEWSNTFKQFVGKSRRIFWMCLTILWGHRLKG